MQKIYANLLQRERQKHFPAGDFDRAVNHTDALLEYLLPTVLGRGSSRSVYLNKQPVRIESSLPSDITEDDKETIKKLFNCETVVKVAHSYHDSLHYGILSNINEHSLWHHFVSRGDKYKEHRRWLCPVLDISQCGKYLTMVKTEKLKEDEMPVKLPSFLSDTQFGNFGWLTVDKEKRIVCHDYGDLSGVYNVNPKIKMIKTIKNV